MKNCREIQRELSAYLDGELTPSWRAEVETHLASCAQCQRELLEMKTLATGVAALPNLESPPQFLAEVRRKIAQAKDPEPMTWQDYVFRPLWLKVPLEVAALIVIIGLVMRTEYPRPAQQVAQLESAETENRENDRVDGVSSGGAAKMTNLDALKTTGANPAPAVETSREALENDKKSVAVMESPVLITAGGARQFADKSLSEPSPAVGATRDVELAQSQPGETVTVHASDFGDVRNRAQQLATRCNGRVIVVPQSKDSTEQTLFVELPPEYVAAFKLELLKTSGPSGALTQGWNGGQAGSMNAATSMTGVLTGNATTNNSINAPGSLSLRDDTAAAPKTVLEIRVVTPAH